MSQKTEIVITAKDQTGTAFASAKRGLDSLKTSASGLANAFSSFGAAGGLVGLIGGAGALSTLKSTIDELDALNLSAERLGVSASKLETLNFAGKLAGLADDDIEKALTKISVKLEEAAVGSKTAIGWFDKLGVSWKDAAGNVKTAEKAFEDVSAKISEMADGTGKVAILVDGFGEKLGRKLAPALNSGAKGLETVRKELELLGGGGKNLDDLAKQADDFNDSIDKLAFWSKAAGRALTSDLLPSLNETATAMLDFASKGQGVLAILRGIAGVGKIPFDLALGPSKADTSVAATIADRRKELAGLENDLKSTQYGGLLGKFIFGKKEDIDNKIAVTKNQIAALEKFSTKIQPEKPEETAKPKPRGGLPEEDPKKARGGGAARTQIDEADRLIASLNEQIALKQADAESTDKMTAAEQQAVKIKYQLKAETLKATEAQQATIFERLDSLAALEKELEKQKEFADALKRQEETNAKAAAAMVEQTLAAEQSAAAYGLSETALSAMTEARLADAIAIANQNAGMEEQAKFLEDELERRQRLTAALEKIDLARLLSGTKTQQDKKAAADVATLDRALSSKKIDQKQYEEAIAALKTDVGELGEFAKQAARNMQDAMADFFINPTKDGIQGFSKTFGETVQKMIAQAGSAQLFKLLLGKDFDKTGDLGGILGDLAKSFGFGKSGGGITGTAGAAAALPSVDLSGMVADVTKQMTTIFDDLTKTISDMVSAISDALSSVDWGSLFGSIASAFGFEKGGIMTSAGPVPLRAYAGGGIANSPQMALFGEGSRPEAFVPLPDGRRIPVAMSGAGGMNITQHITVGANADRADVKRAAASGARSVLALQNGARRYG